MALCPCTEVRLGCLALALTSILTETGLVKSAACPLLRCRDRPLIGFSSFSLARPFSFYRPSRNSTTYCGNNCHCSRESISEQWRVIGLLRCGFVWFLPILGYSDSSIRNFPTLRRNDKVQMPLLQNTRWLVFGHKIRSRMVVEPALRMG